ncbi:MAG: hypothetical protein NC930_02065, partial [Candidatus Omnitrophica bacterium]|nr:hypothetical protein [Candidatus Omnitrophota bacterium]
MGLYCILSSMLNALLSLVFGCFVISRNFRNPKYLTYFLFSQSIAIWSLFYFLLLTAPTAESALLYSRLSMVGFIFIPVFYLHYILSLLNLQSAKRGFLYLSYLFGFASLAAGATAALVSGISSVMMFRFWPEPGVLYSPFVFLWLLMFAYTVWLIYQNLYPSDEVAKKQMKYIFAGTLLGCIGVSTNFFLWYRIPIPPVTHILFSAYVAVTAYAMIRYRLMNIPVIVRRTVVFAGLFAFVFGIFSFGLFVAQEALAAHFRFKWELAVGMSIFLIAFSYEPVRALLIGVTDRYLFQKKYDYQRFLK